MTAPRSSRSRSASPSTPREKRKACQFCFRRKMKCDLRDPTCTNCIENHQECVPVTRPARARPTHARIDELEQDISSLRNFLHHLSSLPAESSSMALARWQRSGSTTVSGISEELAFDHTRYPSRPPRAYSRPSSPGTSIPASPINRFRYGRSGQIAAHGPTSAFFDDLGERDFGAFDPSATTVDENDLREKATARCAEERHMEILNLASGKLNFDGVAPDLAMQLLALHWNRQHFAFLISYRPLFTRDMACSGPYFSQLLLNAIFFSVSKFSERPEVYDDPLDQKTAGKRFLRRVKELLGEALDQSTIPTIQAMLLLSSSLFALGHQSAAWLYSGIAIRMIFDLGLHYDSLPRTSAIGGLSAEEFEIRRRVVWAAFVLDKIISLYQGRAVSFDEEQMHVPHRFLDRYEEQELWTPFAFPGIHRYPGAPARGISTFTSLCSLSVIMGRIITQIYADKVLLEVPAEHLRRLSASLDKWRQSLPSEIAFDPARLDILVPPPHVLSLHSVYYTLVTLLHRPFVETGHQQLADPGIVEISWARCEEAARGATSLLGRYRQTFTLARAPYLISYTIYVAATIHVRIAAQRGSGSEAGRLLAVCLEGLEENAATNPGVRKMYSTISNLMERLGVQLPNAAGERPVVLQNNDPMLTDSLDLSAIIRSFGAEPMLEGPASGMGFPDLNMTFGTEQQTDSLYGFMGFQ